MSVQCILYLIKYIKIKIYCLFHMYLYVSVYKRYMLNLAYFILYSIYVTINEWVNNYGRERGQKRNMKEPMGIEKWWGESYIPKQTTEIWIITKICGPTSEFDGQFQIIFLCRYYLHTSHPFHTPTNSNLYQFLCTIFFIAYFSLN